MICSQCGGAAERCEQCGAGVCGRRFCAELHEASCAVVSMLPGAPPGPITYTRPRPPRRRERNPEAERALAEQLMLTIGHHRHAGRAALLAGDLDAAYDELCAARQLEPDLDRLGAGARTSLPVNWELETDLTPLARALAGRQHPRASDAWRRVLEDRPARSVQAEAAEWLASDLLQHGQLRPALRALHAASTLGRPLPRERFQALYRQAGTAPSAAFNLYLAASHLDAGSARAVVLRDPLTGAAWADQDARWWLRDTPAGLVVETDHQAEALSRAHDLALDERMEGWVMLAEGDHCAGPLGVRTLGRNVRSGCADPGDEDMFVRIRLAYEGAAERLPDVAWPWYRLAELLAWAGFSQSALEHLERGERRSLGAQNADRAALRVLVHAGLGDSPRGGPVAARPFPREPFAQNLWSRLRFRCR